MCLRKSHHKPIYCTKYLTGKREKRINYIMQKSFLIKDLFQSKSMFKNPLYSLIKTPSPDTVHCLFLRALFYLLSVSEFILHMDKERHLHPKLGVEWGQHSCCPKCSEPQLWHLIWACPFHLHQQPSVLTEGFPTSPPSVQKLLLYSIFSQI